MCGGVIALDISYTLLMWDFPHELVFEFLIM